MNASSSSALLVALMCLTGCSGEERDESTAGMSSPAVESAASGVSPNAYDSLFASVEEIYFAGEYD